MSAFFRALIVVAPSLWSHYRRPGTAFLGEYLYGFFAAGFYGALTQAFCNAEPRGLVTILLLAGIGATNQIMELLVHRLFDVPIEPISMSASLAMTVFSTVLTMQFMRRGYLTIKRTSV